MGFQITDYWLSLSVTIMGDGVSSYEWQPHNYLCCLSHHCTSFSFVTILRKAFRVLCRQKLVYLLQGEINTFPTTSASS